MIHFETCELHTLVKAETNEPFDPKKFNVTSFLSTWILSFENALLHPLLYQPAGEYCKIRCIACFLINICVRLWENQTYGAEIQT